MNTSLKKIPTVVSVGFILLGIGLSGGSLGRDVKWNNYNSKTDYCGSGYSQKLYAYQTLWSANDAFSADNINYGVVYRTVNYPSDGENNN